MSMTYLIYLYTSLLTVVKAVDLRNSNHHGTAQLIVLPIHSAYFADSPREAQVGNDLDLYLVLQVKTPQGKKKLVDIFGLLLLN